MAFALIDLAGAFTAVFTIFLAAVVVLVSVLVFTMSDHKVRADLTGPFLAEATPAFLAVDFLADFLTVDFLTDLTAL